MNLPSIQTGNAPDQAADQVTRAIRCGYITPAEGQTMMHLLESRSRVGERVEKKIVSKSWKRRWPPGARCVPIVERAANQGPQTARPSVAADGESR